MLERVKRYLDEYGRGRDAIEIFALLYRVVKTVGKWALALLVAHQTQRLAMPSWEPVFTFLAVLLSALMVAGAFNLLMAGLEKGLLRGTVPIEGEKFARIRVSLPSRFPPAQMSNDETGIVMGAGQDWLPINFVAIRLGDRAGGIVAFPIENNGRTRTIDRWSLRVYPPGVERPVKAEIQGRPSEDVIEKIREEYRDLVYVSSPTDGVSVRPGEPVNVGIMFIVNGLDVSHVEQPGTTLYVTCYDDLDNQYSVPVTLHSISRSS